jgi:CRP-like cAMP-binding protein
MPDSQPHIPPLVRLQYDKNDLIMKEGDFGISVYKILSGRVRVFKQVDKKEIPLANLGPGEFFGEMAFLNRLLEARSASVRASDDVELEVWHPSRLSQEYNQMPPVLKYVINQTLSRLNRMNKVVGQLRAKKKGRKKSPDSEAGISQRKYFRKDFESTCYYGPVGISSKETLGGRIKDISLGGVKMEVSPKNARIFSHDREEKFEISTTLPNGKDLHMVAIVRSVKKNRASGHLVLGLEFTDLAKEVASRIGFFMIS